MSHPNKVARVSPSDHPGPDAGDVAVLPDELWRGVVRTYPGNYDLTEVLSSRLVSHVFADELRYRVYAHVPDTAHFVREMRLMYTFNNRRRQIGQEAYGKAWVMIQRRTLENTSVNRGMDGSIRNSLHRTLLSYMKGPGQLMPAEFDGFVARMQHVWARFYFPTKKMADLETQFARLRAGTTDFDTITEEPPSTPNTNTAVIDN